MEGWVTRPGLMINTGHTGQQKLPPVLLMEPKNAERAAGPTKPASEKGNMVNTNIGNHG